MDFHEYEIKAEGVDVTKGAIYYYGLGLGGEAGEAVDQIKKIYRDHGHAGKDRKKKLFYELGDILWYLARTANKLNFSLEDVAKGNISKLEKRHNVQKE